MLLVVLKDWVTENGKPRMVTKAEAAIKQLIEIRCHLEVYNALGLARYF